MAGLQSHYAEWSKSDKEKYCGLLHTESIKNKKQKKQACRYIKQIGGCQRWVVVEMGEGEGKNNKKNS